MSGSSAKLHGHIGNSLVVSHEKKHDPDPSKQLSHPSPGIYSNRIKLTLKENLCESVARSWAGTEEEIIAVVSRPRYAHKLAPHRSVPLFSSYIPSVPSSTAFPEPWNRADGEHSTVTVLST